MDEASDWELDATLLREWCVGDRRAGEQLFARHGDAVLRFFRNKVSYQDTEELAQETFLRLTRNRERIREGRTLRAYLLGVAKRVLIEHLRKLPRQRALDPAVESIVDLVPGASTIIARREEQELLVNALRQIALEQQILLELHYWERLKATQLAEIMDVKPSTMRTRIQVARDALRAMIARLAANPELVESTLAGLDDWAEQIRVEYLRDKP